MSISERSQSFEREYWQTLYLEDETSVIDGVYNSHSHALYAKSLFELVEFKVCTLCDIGFGLGFMLKNFCKVFKPKFVLGLEPSDYCIKRLQKQNWYKNFNLVILQKKFQDWEATLYKQEPFDLLIINSVIQYFPNSNLENDIKKVSEISRYVYMTLPTKNDYKTMKEELNFVDPYAYQRTSHFYRKIFSKYFHFVSLNVLESKYHKKEQSPFTYELFRF